MRPKGLPRGRVNSSETPRTGPLCPIVCDFVYPVHKNTGMTTKRAPMHLRPTTRRWWSNVVRTWTLDDHHLHLLTAAASALDRAEEAREIIAAEGPYFTNRHGERKPHPALAVERDSRTLFARLLRELDLDVEQAAESSRPPALTRYGGR